MHMGLAARPGPKIFSVLRVRHSLCSNVFNIVGNLIRGDHRLLSVVTDLALKILYENILPVLSSQATVIFHVSFSSSLTEA